MTFDASRVQAICFDIDGTLCDTDDAMVQRWSMAVRKPMFWLKPWQARTLTRRVIMALESPANEAYRWLDWLHLDGAMAALYNRWIRSGRKRKKRPHWIVPGVQSMLETLSRHYPLAVVTTRDEQTTVEFLNQFHLLSCFQVIVTSQTCRHTKPYPEPMFYASKGLNTPPEHCMMVGDTTVDILAGKRAGMQTVGVLCGFGEERELIRAGANSILNTTSDLTQLLNHPLISSISAEQ